jgi:uncharacterized protein
MVNSPAQEAFGKSKSASLPAYCRQCEVRFACNGECPKHRFLKTPDGEDGLNYLCPAYKRFFTHIDEPMQIMTRLLSEGRAPAEIMALGRNASARNQRKNSATWGAIPPSGHSSRAEGTK